MTREQLTMFSGVVLLATSAWSLLTKRRLPLSLGLGAAGALLFGEDLLRELGKLGGT
jgi:hypothetical protein